MSPEPREEWFTEEELNWRAKQLFYKPISMSTISHKIKDKGYITFVDFIADILVIQHNIAIFHGSKILRELFKMLMFLQKKYILKNLLTNQNFSSITRVRCF